MSRRTRSAQTLSKGGNQAVGLDECPICEENIVGESIQCDGVCNSWLHRRCAGLSKTAFERASKSDDKFFCPMCRLTNQEKEIGLLKGNVASLEHKLNSILDKVNVLDDQINQVVPNNIPPAMPSSKSPTPSSYSHAVSKHTNSRESVPNDSTTTPPSNSRKSNRKSNLVIFGVPESDKGTPRHIRTRHDIEHAGAILSTIDPVITDTLIADSFRLGKFKVDQSRPLLVKLTRTSDVQSILMGRKKLASKPGIAIKPDLSPEERGIESLLLKERRTLIDSGVARSVIKLSGKSLLVNKKRFGSVSNGVFCRADSTQSEASSEQSASAHGVCPPSESEGVPDDAVTDDPTVPFGSLDSYSDKPGVHHQD